LWKLLFWGDFQMLKIRFSKMVHLIFKISFGLKSVVVSTQVLV
jgi:hypothetical protein